mmetsp:Transcript_39349/g.37787  ORF Transcript_39349/g.37787 Transcript_39349/m.37787 type:complete len:91 (+) Transcript_39349:1970-2242(+)
MRVDQTYHYEVNPLIEVINKTNITKVANITVKVLTASIVNFTTENELIVEFSDNITVPDANQTELNRAINITILSASGEKSVSWNVSHLN